MIPLAKPYMDEKEIEAVASVLKSGWLTHGPKVKDFEERFANYVGTKHAITVNSCASALHLVLHTLNKKGEIILPSFTFSACANASITAGYTPVFVDIERDTCNINPDEIEKNITSKTTAIMPVHFAGHPCEMDHIMEISEKHNIHIIEDSAECIGATYKNKKTGSFGVGCFSFFPTKNITTGEGGMITTNDDDLAKKINILKAHGISSSTYERERKEKPWFRVAVEAGYNLRMSDINASIGIEQMKKIDEMNEKRIKNSTYLNQNLNHDKIELPTTRKDCTHVFQMYTIKLDTSIDRTKFISFLKENGIGASVHFDPPIHEQQYYLNKFKIKKEHLRVTEGVSKLIVTLPMYPQLTKEDLDKIIETVIAGIKNN